MLITTSYAHLCANKLCCSCSEDSSPRPPCPFLWLQPFSCSTKSSSHVMVQILCPWWYWMACVGLWSSANLNYTERMWGCLACILCHLSSRLRQRNAQAIGLDLRVAAPPAFSFHCALHTICAIYLGHCQFFVSYSCSFVCLQTFATLNHLSSLAL